MTGIGWQAAMMVQVSFVLSSGEWVKKEPCTLGECFPEESEMVAEAAAAIVATGEYVGGGGAAPLFKLEAAS